MIDVEGERYHGESVGMLVDPRTPVIIVAVNGNRVTVRPVTPEDLPDEHQKSDVAVADAKTEPVTSKSDATRIDFDIPKDFSS